MDVLWGTEKIQADIQDSDFLDAVASGKCSFTAGDRLMVEPCIQNKYDEQFRMYIPKEVILYLKSKSYYRR